MWGEEPKGEAEAASSCPVGDTAVDAVAVGASVAAGGAVAVGVVPPNGPQAARERATTPVRQTLASDRR